MRKLILFVFALVGVIGVKSEYKYVTHFSNAFDKELYAQVLDEEKCMRQLRILSNHTLGLQFLDASAKLPSGLFVGNLNDLGDYYECLDINDVINGVDIQGKYCGLSIPMIQDVLASHKSPVWNELAVWLGLAGLPGDSTVDFFMSVTSEARRKLNEYVNERADFNRNGNPGTLRSLSQSPLTIAVGVCIPHACTSKQAIELISKNFPILNLTYTESFCRLPNDKPYAVADYVAMAIFSIIGLITLISSSYDIYNAVILKKDPLQVNKLYTSFSIYTNTRQILTFKKASGNLECLEGIRTLSMLWVVVGHSYSLIILRHVHNTKYLLDWAQKFSSVWLNSAPVTVDTFFLLSGMLCVYTTAGKFNRGQFIKNIHLYYLLRLLRMFPLLAAVVLLQASLFHHISDGPYWNNVAGSVENCRYYWWSTIFHIQNYYNPMEPCIGPSWYLAVDVQLYLLSPLVIMWLFGKKYIAWIVLAVAIILGLITSSIYSFTYNFSSVIGNPYRYAEFPEYIQNYYLNTLPRATPFFIGMAFGYSMHLYRDRAVNISKVNTFLLWTLSLLVMTFCIMSSYPAMQSDHDLQIYDNILNAYMKSAWACALGFVIFACVKGYGGPVNWFLSLDMWKLPSRLTYGVYLLHSPLILTIQGSWLQTYHFSAQDGLYRFISDATLSFILSFFLSIIIDSPCSTLLKMAIAGKTKSGTTLSSKPETNKNNLENKFYKTSL